MSDPIDFDLADVLAQSREYIEQNGWATGEFQVVENEYGVPDENDEAEIIDYEVIGYCAMGGVLYSQEIDEYMCSSDLRSLAVADALCRAVGLKTNHTPAECTRDGICSCVINLVTDWNDHTATEQEVLDAFMKAEKDARSGNVDG
jgi:hypothetical protein